MIYHNLILVKLSNPSRKQHKFWKIKKNYQTNKQQGKQQIELKNLSKQNQSKLNKRQDRKSNSNKSQKKSKKDSINIYKTRLIFMKTKKGNLG